MTEQEKAHALVVLAELNTSMRAIAMAMNGICMILDREAERDKANAER